MRIAQSALDYALSPLTLLTSLPIARRRMDLPLASPALFPVAGLLIGGILAAFDALTRSLLPSPANSALVVVALAALTGGLHLDGLADAADGLFGCRDRARRLAIMRDPHTGAFGVAAIVSILLLKWAALIPLEGWLRLGSLLLAPAIARWSLLLPMMLFPSARHEGMAFELQSKSRWSQAALGTAITAGLSLAIFWPAGAALAGAALIVALVIGSYATRSVGGLTGDVFGTMVETNEAFLFLLVATSVSHPWLT